MTTTAYRLNTSGDFQLDWPTVKISIRNSKLAKAPRKMPNWSIPAGLTCPGASDYCAIICYAKTGFFNMPRVRNAYDSNFEASQHPHFVPAMIQAITDIGDDKFRIHASGDFYSVAYIQAWQAIAEAMPHVTFFGYTRSWNVPGLVNALEVLRALPNVQLFASLDDSMPDAPIGWRIAYMEGTQRLTYKPSGKLALLKGMVCLEQVGKKPDCASCGYCFIKKAGDVEFIEHSTMKPKA
jgi:hypothetical protein